MRGITDFDTLAEIILRFEAFVRAKDTQSGFFSDVISFSDSGAWLHDEEYYKRDIYTKIMAAMNCMSWDDKEIGSGKIAKSVHDAIKCAGKDSNLVDWRNILKFNDKFDNQGTKPDYQVLDRVFYNLYRGNDDKTAFEELTKIFGKSYDVIAFLFFIKNPDCYLPIRSRSIDKGLSRLGINYKTAYRCSWENYIGYVEVLSAIQEALNDLLPMRSPASLLDAHSFVWIIQNEEYYSLLLGIETENKISEKKSVAGSFLRDKALSYGADLPEYRDVKTLACKRDPNVVKWARKWANGKCQLCGNYAPFNDKSGQPYLEVHHIVWLSKGGSDKVYNAIALCPNCHSKMHIVDNPDDVQFLEKKAKEWCQTLV